MDETDALSTQGEQRPNSQDRQAWQAFWATQGKPWRTEPEIDTERQAELAARRNMTPDVAQGLYPFTGMKLSRADIEWLLATHEDGRGPVDSHDQSQRDRVGLDLRGADLSYAQLQNLPLACTIGDVTWRTWTMLTEKQHRMAAMHLQQADLKGAHLEGSGLEYANLEGADLRECHLEEANLGSANLQRAYCEQAHLERADLWFAHLEGAFLWHTYLQGARLYEAHLEGAHLDRLVLADENQVGPRLVDTNWGDANLAVVDWSQIRLLGEEDEARQQKREGKVKDRQTRVTEYEVAVRANRQLALALQSQGLSEDAARFSYRAQVLQRKALWFGGLPKLGQYFFSLFLAALTGYGYRMWRILVAYALLNVFFASLYYLFGVFYAPPHLAWTEALIVSVTAFHGRVFSSAFLPGSPQSTVTALEAVTGLIFEGVFIAMLTQKFFGR
jgi:uncharacterized protein YjbI with pentapeptide repeats